MRIELLDEQGSRRGRGPGALRPEGSANPSAHSRTAVPHPVTKNIGKSSAFAAVEPGGTLRYGGILPPKSGRRGLGRAAAVCSEHVPASGRLHA
ncbi:hypothetical protein VTN96DRAFT_7760 [Rasamsonia emersonii]